VFNRLKKNSGPNEPSSVLNDRRGRAIPIAVLLIFVVLLSMGSGIYASASYFAQQANVTVTTTIYTTTTIWTTSTIWSTATSTVLGVLTTVQYTTSTSTVTITSSTSYAPSTFGDTNIEGASDGWQNVWVWAEKWTLSNSGTVQSMTVYVQSYVSGCKLRLGIYNDASNYPGSLVAGGDELTVGATGWNTVTFSTPGQLTAGNYWLSVLVEYGNKGYVGRGTASGGTIYFKAATSTTMPRTFPSGGTSSSYQESLYATYIPT
jgi:preprotein translocase subunit SecG